MTVLDSLVVGLFGLSVVFVVLVGLSLLIRLQAALVGRAAGKRAAGTGAEARPEEAREAPAEADEPLALVNVDEKTAALVMAIVCEELKAQPEELRFKSVKALDEDEGKQGEEP